MGKKATNKATNTTTVEKKGKTWPLGQIIPDDPSVFDFTGQMYSYIWDYEIKEYDTFPYDNRQIKIHEQRFWDNTVQPAIDENITYFDIHQKVDPPAIISSAINFLKQAALSERSKEIKAINKHRDELINNPTVQTLLKAEDKKAVTDIIDSLNRISNDLAAGTIQDPKNIETFYTRLIALLNSVRQDSAVFLERIKQICDKRNKDWHELYAEGPNFRIKTDIDRLLSMMTGIAQRDKDSFSTNLAKLLLDRLQNIVAKSQLAQDRPLEVILAVIMKFEGYLNSLFARRDEKDAAATFDEFSKRVLNEAWNTFEAQDELIQQILNDDQQLIKQLELLHATMGCEVTTDIDLIKKRQEIFNKTSKAKGTINGQSGYWSTLLSNEFGGEPAYKISCQGHGKGMKDTLHGIIYEMLTQFNATHDGFFSRKVSGSPATDLLTTDLGKIEMSVQIRDEILKKIDSISKAYTKLSTELGTAIKRKDSYDLNGAYDVVDTTLRQLNQLMQENNIQEDIFIYNDSLKLHGQVEIGKKLGFDGRDIKIHAAIDEMYSATGSQLTLPDIDILKALVVNLCDVAISPNIQNTLTDYFSIFAGLLMFDDVKFVAEDIAKNLNNDIQQNAQAYMINIYLLNGVYIPSSIILSKTAAFMEEGVEQLSAQRNIATATITVPRSKAGDIRGQDYTRYSFVDKNGNENGKAAWDNAADDILDDTKLQITALKGFVTFIEQLSQQMGR